MKPIEDITYLPVVGWVARNQDGSYVHITESNDPVWILFLSSIWSVQEGLGVDDPDPADEKQIHDLLLKAFKKMEETVPDVLDVIQDAWVVGSSPTPVGRVVSGEEAIREGLIPDTPANRRDQWRISSTGSITRDTGAGTATDKFDAEVIELYSRIEEVQDRINRAMQAGTGGRPPGQPTEKDERRLESLQRQLATMLGEEPEYEGYDPPGTPGQVIPEGWQLAPGGINRTTGETIWTLERTPEEAGPRSLDELLFQSIQTGQPLTAAQIDGIIYVDKIRDWLDRRTITPEEAFNLAAPLMENPQHLSEMMTALLSETGQDIPFPEFNAGMSANAPLTKDSTGPGSDEVAVQQPNTLADALARPSDTAVFGDPISSPGDTAPVEGGILSQYEQDIQTYTADIRLNPQDPWGYYNRGVTHYNQGQYERAIQDYGEAIRLNPEFDWAKRNRDFAYDRLEEQDAKDVDPLTGDAGGVNTLAATLASQGDPLLSLSGDTGTSNWGENRVVSIGSPDPTLAAVQAAMAAPEFASLTEDQQIAAIRIAVAGSRYPGVDPIDAYVMGERDGTNPSRAEIIRLAHQSRAASQGRPAPTFPGDRGVNALAPAGVAAFNALTGRAQQGVQVDPESDRYKAMPEAANYAEELKKQQGRPYVTATGEYGGGTQYVPTSPIGAAGTPALGFGGQLPAYGGTPFYPITPGQSPQGTFQALGVGGWNKRQQELFKERGPQRKVFG